MKKVISVILAIVLMAVPLTVGASAFDSTAATEVTETSDESTTNEPTSSDDDEATNPTTPQNESTDGRKSLPQLLLLGLIDIAWVIALPAGLSALAGILAWPLMPIFLPFAIVLGPLYQPLILLKKLYTNIYGIEP